MEGKWLVKYETDTGEVKLSYDIVKKYLVSGDPSKVTDQEVMMFINLCKYQKLNPFLREAYLIKFGNEPATLVTGKDTFTKRAAKSKLCAGYEAGVIVQKKNGEMEYRKGTLVAPNETLVGGWAKVYRKDWNVPLETSVSLQEYQRKTKDGRIFSNWANMPATMIRKVALVQALREALPEEFQGLYSPEEMPVDDSHLEEKPIEVNYTVEEQQEEAKEESVEKQKISLAQAKRMFAIAQGDKDIVRQVLDKYGYEHSKDVAKEDYDKICAEIEQAVKQKTQEEQQEPIDTDFTVIEEDIPLPWEERAEERAEG
ncbi:phage recombination protein Bet [Thermoanaerobacter sp. YS13]|uniref:phage recombination protein Bet n=1 Tax=Thermoanaerobacter sp. YS13 TaxID=1511746 RepID=UPI0005736C66|nr:phage recombination protein Bet [Thermoanaerobacter sp. YS13]KHO63383.1 phage recombination protein Bet [Thermoanaerobacter sp. YS13]